MNPAALSSRIVGTKALARESAARLLANAPCIPRLRDEVFPRTIGPSCPEFDAWLGAKNVSRSRSARAAPGRTRLIRASPTSEGPPRNLDPDGPLTCRYIRGQVDRSTAATTDDRLKTESAGRPWLKRGAAGKSPGVQVWIVGRRSTPAGEASLNPVPHASRGLLPLVHYCPKAGFGTYLEAGAAVSVLVPSPASFHCRDVR
jgi:hypothetical protein